MADADCELLNYLKLAVFSAEKSQPLGRDRFLVLAGEAACRAACLDVAERCRALVLRENPRHLLGQFESFPDALRSAEFDPLRRHLQRLCPPEHAEFLLQQQDGELAEMCESAPSLLDWIESRANPA